MQGNKGGTGNRLLSSTLLQNLSNYYQPLLLSITPKPSNNKC